MIGGSACIQLYTGPDTLVQARALLTWLATTDVDQLDIAMHKQVGKPLPARRWCCSRRQLC